MFKIGTHWREKKPWWDKPWLENEYITKKRSSGDIASEYGVTDAAIQYWLRKHKIPTRSVSEARAIKYWGACGSDNPRYGKVGPESPTWKGGSTPDRQRDYSRSDIQGFLRFVRCRDKVCRLCGEQALLHVHHIKSFAEYPESRYDPDNCVALCGWCHRWVHSKKNKDGIFLYVDDG